MTRRERAVFTLAWVALAINGVGIAGFGLAATLWPGSTGAPWLRAIGLASIGMGLFGLVLTVIAYRRRERWAWFTLWYYPVFWIAHLVGDVPPGRDHVHQVVFVALSLLGLLLPAGQFFSRRAHRRA